MEVIHHHLLPVWLLFILLFSYGKSEQCRAIQLDDAKVAAQASNAIYYGGISMGRNVPGTSFKVTKIMNPSLYGQPLKAFVATHGHTTLICFRGTQTAMQLAHQIYSRFKTRKSLTFNGIRVHIMSYVWLAFLRFSPDSLVPAISSERKYIITGHSLGGAIASLFSIYMKRNQGKMWTNSGSCLITFGAPRVGDANYAIAHDKLIPPSRKIRFVYRHDIVPHIPNKPWYRHHSREVWIWKKRRITWWNIKLETYWTVCKAGDPSRCSNKNIHNEPLSHKMILYRNAVVNQRPRRFYDKNGRTRWSFEDAQCR